jgi:hypothetical protein
MMKPSDRNACRKVKLFMFGLGLLSGFADDIKFSGTKNGAVIQVKLHPRKVTF